MAPVLIKGKLRASVIQVGCFSGTEGQDVAESYPGVLADPAEQQRLAGELDGRHCQ